MKVMKAMKAMKAITIATAALTVIAVVPAQTTKTILKNGPTSNRYDMVILGDGYRLAEQGKFDTDCQKFVTALFKKEPYKTFKTFFNVHTVFRASKESGADHPDRKPPIVKDTVYDASYNTGGTARCLYIKNTRQALQDAALAPANEGRVLVFVNDSRYGGCAGTFAVSYNGSSMAEVQIHELGHSFGRLADEYDYPNNRYTGPEPSQKNVTTDSTGRRKWAHWLGSNGVSTFEGARYYRRGLFRPVTNCLMRSLNRPLCAVCREQIVLQGYTTVSAIEDPQPATNEVCLTKTGKQTFSFKNIGSQASKITWRINGNAVTGANTASFLLDASTIKVGENTLTAEVKDLSSFVRSDPGNLLTSKHSWNIFVGPKLADLKILHLSARSPSVRAGATLELIQVSTNDGRADANSVLVEYFLSTDKKLTSSDTYLGGYTVPTIKGRGGVHARSPHKVDIPAHVLPGNYHVGVWVDRENKITELDETNNIETAPVKIDKPSCAARLAYDDRLVYPTNNASLSTTAGGSLHPTVTAACNAGDGYLILMNCSGTTPGTRAGPGITLPLNLDACSTIAYGLVNSPYLLAFQGTLNGNGHGRATLKIPGKALKASFQGHLAALVFDKKSFVFKAATNPVQLTLK